MSQNGSFYHIMGNRGLGYKYHPKKIDIRLYLSPNEKNTGKIVEEFTKKSLDKKSPFYLKFAFNSSRVDQIVVYTNYQDAKKFVNIINEIKEKSPELFSDYKELHPLWGKLNNIIGFGEERTIPNQSYGCERAEFSSDVIEKVTSVLINRALNEDLSKKDLDKNFKTVI